MKSKVFVCLILVMTILTALYGQKNGKMTRVKGSVVDGTGVSISNAIIMIDGKKTSVVTDRNGSYQIKVSPENKKIGILTFTNGIVEEALDGRNIINFKFEGSVPNQKNDEVDRDEEAIDIGYGNVKRKNLTSPVGEIDGTKSKYASYNSIYEMIRERFRVFR